MRVPTRKALLMCDALLYARIKDLEAERDEWKERCEAERHDHEATIAHCNRYHVDTGENG